MSPYFICVIKYDGTFAREGDPFPNEQNNVVKVLNGNVPADIGRYFPFAEELILKNQYRINVKGCHNLKKVICDNCYILELGKIRPKIKGDTTYFYLEQYYDSFPFLQYSEMIIQK